MKTARPTFRLRLAVHTMLVAGLLVISIGAGSWWYARRQLARNLDLRLIEATRRLWSQLTPRHSAAEIRDAADGVFGQAELDRGNLAVVVQTHAPGHALIFANAAAPAKGFADRLPSGAGVVTVPDDSRPLERTPPAPRGTLRRPQMPEIRPPDYFTWGGWRYVGLSSPRYTVFVGLSSDDFYAEVRRAAIGFGAASVAGLVLAGVGAWWLAGRAMRPLQRVVTTAEKLNVAELGEAIPVTASDDREFARLITVFNAMMDRLHASFQHVARFTADASHELKTPLAVMQATLYETLRNSPPEQHLALETVLAEVARLKSITQSLLLLSQADAGKLSLHRECYDLSVELSGIVEDAEALCAENGLHCRHEIAQGVEVEADRALMRPVFRNLLANAIRYNRPDGSVTIRLERDGSSAVFSITNTGPAIPPEKQQRLFERFFRADSARPGEGTGLGLNIAFELARANGSEVALVESVDDRTTFRVRMPCGASEPVPATLSAAAEGLRKSRLEG